MDKLTERDWKKIRSLKDENLNKACERILKKVTEIINREEGTPHKKYLDIRRLLKNEAEQIGRVFNDLKRSNAGLKLASWKVNGLLSDDELKEFSEGTNRFIEIYTEQ